MEPLIPDIIPESRKPLGDPHPDNYEYEDYEEE